MMCDSLRPSCSSRLWSTDLCTIIERVSGVVVLINPGYYVRRDDRSTFRYLNVERVRALITTLFQIAPLTMPGYNEIQQATILAQDISLWLRLSA